jgi:hypothetical protein
LGELTESDDERVALLAWQAPLDRGFGRPRGFIYLSPTDASVVEERRRKLTAVLAAQLDAKAATRGVGSTAENSASNGDVPVPARQEG